MADIKTRQVNKGSVKTIDRAANLSGRLRDTTVRTKEGIREHVGRDDRNESAYATDSTVHMAERGVRPCIPSKEIPGTCVKGSRIS